MPLRGGKQLKHVLSNNNDLCIISYTFNIVAVADLMTQEFFSYGIRPLATDFSHHA